MPDAIEALWRFPVKSMQGEPAPELLVTRTGVAGDRAWGVYDVEGGGIASAKDTRRFPELMQCRARFLAPPLAQGAAPHVEITLPDGQRLRSDAAGTDAALSAFFGRAVKLVRAVPGMLTYGQYTRWHGEAGEATGVPEGVAAALPPGALRDAFPMSLLTTSTLAALQASQPDSVFDLRRFRMNVIIRTAEAGFVENGWPGRTVALGPDCRLAARLPDPRCVMTTLPQGELARDAAILKTIARHNRLLVPGHGLYPCAGVYAEVLRGGMLRVGDGVRCPA